MFDIEGQVGRAVQPVMRSLAFKPLIQLGPTSPSGGVSNRHGDGLLLTDQNDELFAAGDARVKEVSLQHRIVLGQCREPSWRENSIAGKSNA